MTARKAAPQIAVPEGTPSTPVSTPEEDSARIAALVQAQVAAAIADLQPKISSVRCKAGWHMVTLGLPGSTGLNDSGTCFECSSKGFVLDYSYSVCQRLNFPRGNFYPGTAEVVANHLGLTLDDLLDETKVTQDDLAAAWDESVVRKGGPRRPPTNTERRKTESIQYAQAKESKLRGLIAQRESINRTVVDAQNRLLSINEQIEQMELEAKQDGADN